MRPSATTAWPCSSAWRTGWVAWPPSSICPPESCSRGNGGALPASAITVTRVEVSGLPNELMAQNVRVSLSLNDELGKDLSARRLNYLLREAEAETREALEPFGYYSPTIVIQRSDRNQPEDEDAEPAARSAAAATAGER